MHSLKISIITPTSNSAETIEKCVKSVTAQSFTSFEHIIIDNLSSDKTTEKIKNIYRQSGLLNNLKIISEEDSGISDAFNKGIKNSTGEFIAILNSDDYYLHSNVFDSVVNGFANKKILFVHGDVYFSDDKYGSNIRKPLLCPVQQAMPYNHPSMFFRKNVYDEYGGFDTSYKYAMDFEFICKLTSQIKDFEKHGFYIQENPIVCVSCGGASWVSEKESVIEGKTALQKNILWNSTAVYYYLMRRSRILLKPFLNETGLLSLIKFWRKVKWK